MTLTSLLCRQLYLEKSQPVQDFAMAISLFLCNSPSVKLHSELGI